MQPYAKNGSAASHQTGWVKLHRKMLSSSMTLAEQGLFVRILLRASSRGQTFRGQTVEPGSFYLSLRQACQELNIGRNYLTKLLESLEGQGRITRETQTLREDGKPPLKLTLITVVNWSRFQDEDGGSPREPWGGSPGEPWEDGGSPGEPGVALHGSQGWLSRRASNRTRMHRTRMP